MLTEVQLHLKLPMEFPIEAGLNGGPGTNNWKASICLATAVKMIFLENITGVAAVFCLFYVDFIKIYEYMSRVVLMNLND